MANRYNKVTRREPIDNMTVDTQPKKYSAEKYLELEEKADYKSEYRDGEIVPMTGGTTNHNKIALNFAAYLKFAIRHKPYDIYIGDVRLWIPRYRQYTYPDVMVIQGNPVYAGTGTTTVTNPTLIVEVLSQSTQNYDQGDKFMYYRSIPDLQEYLLLDQKRCYALRYLKNEESFWVLSEYEGNTFKIGLGSIDFEISPDEIYEGVNFENEEA